MSLLLPVALTFRSEQITPGTDESHHSSLWALFSATDCFPVLELLWAIEADFVGRRSWHIKLFPRRFANELMPSKVGGESCGC